MISFTFPMSAKCPRCLQFPGRRAGASGFTLDLCTCTAVGIAERVAPALPPLALPSGTISSLCPPVRLCQHFPSMMLSLHYWPSWSWKRGFVSQKVRAERYKSIMIVRARGVFPGLSETGEGQKLCGRGSRLRRKTCACAPRRVRIFGIVIALSVP